MGLDMKAPTACSRHSMSLSEHISFTEGFYHRLAVGG